MMSHRAATQHEFEGSIQEISVWKKCSCLRILDGYYLNPKILCYRQTLLRYMYMYSYNIHVQYIERVHLAFHALSLVTPHCYFSSANTHNFIQFWVNHKCVGTSSMGILVGTMHMYVYAYGLM